MRTENLDIRQWMMWLGGLMVAWLLIVLPIRPVASALVSSKQTYISWDASQDSSTAADSHCLPEVRSNAPVALVSSRAGFSFVPSPVFLQWWLDELYRALRIALLDQP